MLPATNDNWMERFDTPARLFESVFGAADGVDLYEEDGAFVLTVDVPGFDPEEIDLTFDDGILNVAAEREETRDESVRTRTFHQSFRFPKDVSPEEITATYTNGVLEVTLPIRSTEELRGRDVPIQD